MNIGEFDKEMYIRIYVDGKIVNVPCGGVWRKFYKIVGYNLAINDCELVQERYSGHLFSYYDKKIRRKITEKLMEELESKLRITDKHNLDRKVTEYTYKLPVAMIDPEELQSLIQAALGDVDAKKKVIDMLVKLDDE